jgi:hypothetical protein
MYWRPIEELVEEGQYAFRWSYSYHPEGGITKGIVTGEMSEGRISGDDDTPCDVITHFMPLAPLEALLGEGE